MYGIIPVAASFSRQGMRHDRLAVFVMAFAFLTGVLVDLIVSRNNVPGLYKQAGHHLLP